MPVVNPQALEYETFKLRNTDFVSGDEDGTALSAGQIGEIGTLEVGADGQASAYDAVLIGQPAAKLFVELFNATPTALPDSTEFRLVARDKNSNRRKPLTAWISQRDAANGDPRQRPTVGPREPFIKAGRIIGLEIKNEGQGVTGSLGDCTVEVPAQGGY